MSLESSDAYEGKLGSKNVHPQNIAFSKLDQFFSVNFEKATTSMIQKFEGSGEKTEKSSEKSRIKA